MAVQLLGIFLALFALYGCVSALIRIQEDNSRIKKWDEIINSLNKQDKPE
jgi:hypothetical protein